MEGRHAAHYLIREKLGEGGMGEVYLAEDTSLGRTVAIKFLSESLESDEIAHKRFIREAKAAAALDHPFICRVYEVAEIESRPFIVMEYVEGLTLREELKKGPLDSRKGLSLAIEVAEALEAAHSKGFVHRDLKPSNIMLTVRGHVRVMDFGLARQIERADHEEDLTATQLTGDSSTVGTVAYMSPEQLSGEEISSNSDIFSFGVLLYEMFSGVHPFRRTTRIATAHAILGGTPAPLSDHGCEVSNRLERLVHGMLAKKAEQRIQPIDAVRAELLECIPAGLRYRGAFFYWAVVTAIFLLVVVTLFIYIYHQPEQDILQPNLRQLTFESGIVMEPSWSPDGQFIAYTSDSSGNFDIWVRHVSGGKAIQVTKSPAEDGSPSWSPDGDEIVFRSSRDGGGIYLVSAPLGGNVERISSTGYKPKWSPDGRHILIKTEPEIGHAEGREAPVRVIASNGEDVQTLTLSGSRIRSADWHPDGRVSLLVQNRGREFCFWTISLDGDDRVESDFPPELSRQISEGEFVPLDFLWSPLRGDHLFLMAVSGGAPDLFKVRVEERSLRWISNPKAMTRSSTLELGMALSRDGKDLAFTPGTVRTGIWLFPFEASAGEILGDGQLVSPGGLNATRPDMSVKSGSRILYRLYSPDGVELWSKSLDEGSEELLLQSSSGGGARWAPDGEWFCHESVEGGGIRFVLRSRSGEKVNLTSPLYGSLALSGFSSDGNWVLVSLPGKNDGDHAEIVKLPIDKAPRAEESAITLASHPDFNLWQPRFSPDDRWVAFVAIKRADPQGVATLHVVPGTGGDWVSITKGRAWNDKPRWAPDGRTIYFVSNRGGYFNVWGQRFDVTHGQTVGEAFRVTNFRLPGKVVLEEVVELELTLSENRLVLPLTQVSAENIWVLEDVND